jgi:catechol 2,3-dioxygenase-like lactoylglutathione lyase family enzyme
MIDHVTIRVPALDEAVRFYGRALELVGGRRRRFAVSLPMAVPGVGVRGRPRRPLRNP